MINQHIELMESLRTSTINLNLLKETKLNVTMMEMVMQIYSADKPRSYQIGLIILKMVYFLLEMKEIIS